MCAEKHGKANLIKSEKSAFLKRVHSVLAEIVFHNDGLFESSALPRSRSRSRGRDNGRSYGGHGGRKGSKEAMQVRVGAQFHSTVLANSTRCEAECDTSSVQLRDMPAISVGVYRFQNSAEEVTLVACLQDASNGSSLNSINYFVRPNRSGFFRRKY